MPLAFEELFVCVFFFGRTVMGSSILDFDLAGRVLATLLPRWERGGGGVSRGKEADVLVVSFGGVNVLRFYSQSARD